jgi:putative ABC transport system ATP-binding protein
VAALTQGAPSDSASDAVIVTRGLGCDYRMGDEVVHALHDVSVDVCTGEFVSIMGPSGCGKTTFMNLIGCLDNPTRGQYWLNGLAVASLDEHELARVRNREIGFVFQTFNLLPRATAAANVALPLTYAGVPRKERRQQAEDALRRLGLGDRTHHRPSELSGGERQRVAIARALVCEPSLILADEPTGNLDSKTSAEILGVFDELHADGHTIVIVTHEAEVAAHSHRQIRLLDGGVDYDSAAEARA